MEPPSRARCVVGARKVRTRRVLGLVLACAVAPGWVSPAAGFAQDTKDPRADVARQTPAAAANERRRKALEAQKLDLELEKLRLEIAKLRPEQRKLEREASTEGRLAALAAPLTVFVAALSLGVGYRQYRRDERKQRQTRAEDGIADNRQRIIDAVKGKSAVHAQTVSSLQNLTELVQRVPDPEAERLGITKCLVGLVSFDIDFADFEQATFDVVCLEGWEPYREHWRADPGSNEFILSRYDNAFASVVARSDPRRFAMPTGPAMCFI
jgi:hypothetical protein